MQKISTSLLLFACVCFFAPLFSQSYYSSRSTSAENQQTQTGNAVYYADYLAGRTTAMGEIYRPEEYTAAHKTYPQGTLLKVTRQDNNQSVVVRVNDRGPYDEGVIVDLSKAAAMDIGLLRDGRAPVRIEVVGRSDTNPRRGQYVQQQQPQQYSNNPYRSNTSSYRSQQYPGAASRSNYRSAASSNTSAPYYDNTAQRSRSNYSNTPSSYSGYTGNTSRDNQLTARGGYSENLYPQESRDNNRSYYQQPQSYSQSSSRRIPTNNYTPAGESPAVSQSRSVRQTESYMLPGSTKGYAVQLASYKNGDNARRQLKQFQDKGLTDLYIWQKSGYNKIIIAIFPTKTAAQQYLESVRRAYQMDGLVVKVG